MLNIHYSNPLTVVPIDVSNLVAAKETIDMAAYALVEPEIVNALATAAGRGVKIRLYLDRTELEAEARGDVALSHMALHNLLNLDNVEIRVKNSSVLMHLKSFLVDGIILRDGSANFSVPGEEEQDNSLILTDDPTLCAAFVAKFSAMWARPDNLSVTTAVESHPQASHTPLHRR
jgi:phosphatidylserine/phosphatidylglycerophosphate/cardiolipin synthase-like enzyme